MIVGVLFIAEDDDEMFKIQGTECNGNEKNEAKKSIGKVRTLSSLAL